MNMKNNKRLIAIIVLIVIAFALLISKIVYLQIFSGNELLAKSERRISKNSVVIAPRGEILDRNGNSLVISREGYSVFIEKGDNKSEDFNKSLLQLYNDFLSEKIIYKDTFPISLCPFVFLQTSDELLANKDFIGFIKNKVNTKNLTADKVMDALIKIYKLEEFELDEARIILGIRYEMEKTLKTSGLVFEFASNVPISIVTKLMERQSSLEGIFVEPIYNREYIYDNFAGHILGRTGKMSDSEFLILKEKGYLLNDIVGKDGIEYTFEEYLKGKDGVKQISRDVNNKIVNTVNKENPVAGNNVTLTIDKELQMAAESSLASHIEQIKLGIPPGQPGHDIMGASMVIMDVNKGEVLSLANYPTINLNKFNENFDSYKKDPLTPLVNRGISSAYPSGSSFKMLTGIAAFETDSIPINFTYSCGGKYRFFSDYQPTCYRGHSHGLVNIEKALRVSCNGFFFDAGRLTGIKKLNDYASIFGLGKSSEIELPGETDGLLATPGYLESQMKTWTTADTIQFSIGQSYNMFTTMQMAGYVSMIATNGTRYKTHIVKNVINPITNELIVDKKPEIAQQITLKQTTVDLIKSGMAQAISQGASSGVFKGCTTSVAGKTGTAEVPNGSSNGTFICYAPIENPQIAIAITAEHIGEGSYLAVIAREMIDKYFIK